MIPGPKRSINVNTRLISYFTVFVFAVTSASVRADGSAEIAQELVAGEVTPSAVTAPALADSVEGDTLDDDYSAPQGTEVGKTDETSKKAHKKQMWMNIGLAVAAVVVAVVALILVSNNNGHHSK